uniref:B-box C-terminal domain-containing protein n=2 Tax=Arion vulgaris TaxID=1028688 RepID=A0A0B7AQR5_9EUPU
MFCVTCEMNICMDCAMSGHGDHDYQFVTKELFQNQMADVDRLIQTVIPQVKAVDDQLKSLADIKVTTNESSVKVRDEVNDFMDTYVEAIEKHRKQLLTQIKSLVEDTERSVDATQLQLQQVRADVEQTCLFIGELLTSGTDVEILSLKKLLTHRLTSLHEVSRETQFKQHGVMRFCPTAKGDIINNFQMFGRVIVNQASAAESFLYGKGLTTSCVSKKSSMILTICDNNGVPYTGSDVTIETWIEFRGQKINVPVICKYKKGGVYMIELTPVSEGPHFLHVFVDGRSIKDSPFKFNVKGKWRNHTGTWQRPIHCFTTELKDQGGCNLGNISHTDVSFWSCCGKKIQGSSCSANSSRNSPVRQATF